jgi:membrane complex biogenesis BtpA family protein
MSFEITTSSAPSFRLIGVLHLPPLPGAANYRGASVRQIARIAAEDALVLADAGFTDVMIQDASDNPQPDRVGAATVAAMAVIGAEVRRAVGIPLGVVAGHNDGEASVAIAHAIDAQFIRVKVLTGVSAGPAGWIEGCSHRVAMLRRLLGSDVEVWADAHEATSRAIVGDVVWAAQEAVSFGGASKVIVTRDSGVADAVTDIAAVKAVIGDDVDVLIGGRVNLGNLTIARAGANGAILGSAIKTGPDDEARIDPAAARAFALT